MVCTVGTILTGIARTLVDIYNYHENETKTLRISNSVVVLFVLCFGVEFYMLFAPLYAFYILNKARITSEIT